MGNIRVFIADTDEAHITHIRNSAARRDGITVVGVSMDGCETMRQIISDPPDVLLMDLQLPGMDGITLLRDLKRMKRLPVTIVCTHFYSDICVRRACQYGASYFMYKPLDYNRLMEVLTECYRARGDSASRMTDEPGLARTIRRKLYQIGIPASLNGSLYLTESLIRLKQDETLIQNLSKGLYAQIAESVHATPTRVERSLRNAIAIGYDRGSLKETFKAKPTNREFIEYMLNSLDE